MLEPNATNGQVRQVRGEKINTADIVNAAIQHTNEQGLDMDAARQSLQQMGHMAPDDSLVEMYALQTALLAEIENMTGASTTRQIGKWDFSNAQAIHDAFNNYLTRRYKGHQSRYGRR